MRNVTLRSLQATTVIAAVLALGSTPAFAQDASAPFVDAPAVASAPAPAPVEAPPLTTPAPQIVLPDVTAPVAQAPDAAAPKASVTRTERHVVKDHVVKETATTPVRTQARTAAVPSAPTANTAPVAPVPASRVAVPVAAKTLSDRDAFNSGSRIGDAPQPDRDIKAAPLLPGDSGMVAGGVVVLFGLGAAALLAARRRKAGEQVYEPYGAGPVTPTATVPSKPAFVLEPPEPLARPSTSANGSVSTGEAREALLNAMVNEAASAENPFTSGKSRRHRARLILQAREQRQKETKQPFDFRTYQNPVRATGAEAHRTPSPVDA